MIRDIERIYRPSGIRTQSNQGNGVQFLFPYRSGFRPSSKEEYHRRRTRKRIRSRIDIGSGDKNHGYRSITILTPIRKIPQSCTYFDA